MSKALQQPVSKNQEPKRWLGLLLPNVVATLIIWLIPLDKVATAILAPCLQSIMGWFKIGGIGYSKTMACLQNQ